MKRSVQVKLIQQTTKSGLKEIENKSKTENKQ